MSVEEILARKQLKDSGQNPDSATEVLALRNRVKTAEEALAARDKKPTTPGEARKSLELLLDHYEVSPAEELIKIAMEKRPNGEFLLPVMDRAAIWQGMMRYTTPQLKAVEHSGKIDTNINVTVMDYSTKVVIDQRTQVINNSDA
jgi:hypothetical protein